MNYTGLAGVSTTRRSALAVTGVPFVLMHWALVGLLLIVLGGVVMIAARLGPRVAVDPIQGPDGTYRLRPTWNGLPIFHRGRHRS
jgi:hypothetical protein